MKINNIFLSFSKTNFNELSRYMKKSYFSILIFCQLRRGEVPSSAAYKIINYNFRDFRHRSCEYQTIVKYENSRKFSAASPLIATLYAFTLLILPTRNHVGEYLRNRSSTIKRSAQTFLCKTCLRHPDRLA